MKDRKRNSVFDQSSHEKKLKNTSLLSIKVNGVTVTMEDYLKDPKKYNSIKIPEDLLKEVSESMVKSQAYKDRFYIDPSVVHLIL